jgi:ribosomal protein L11 methyltransferase
MKPEGLFIASGIIDDKIDFVVEGLEASGFEVVEVRRRGEWAAILAR